MAHSLKIQPKEMIRMPVEDHYRKLDQEAEAIKEQGLHREYQQRLAILDNVLPVLQAFVDACVANPPMKMIWADNVVTWPVTPLILHPSYSESGIRSADCLAVSQSLELMKVNMTEKEYNEPSPRKRASDVRKFCIERHYHTHDFGTEKWSWACAVSGAGLESDLKDIYRNLTGRSYDEVFPKD